MSNEMIETFAKRIPVELHLESGKVFYSGRKAFASPSPLYLIGLNPGGDPSLDKDETVRSHTDLVLHFYPDNWSAYRDEKWGSELPGTQGLAPRVIHLINKLGFDPGLVPSSNLFFVRSRREKNIRNSIKKLSELCWPFHALVIEKLCPKVILCFGRTAGNYVRNRIGAEKLLWEFIEDNRRKWKSQVYANPMGLQVVIATHPSIAKWTEQNVDPSELVKKALNAA